MLEGSDFLEFLALFAIYWAFMNEVEAKLAKGVEALVNWPETWVLCLRAYGLTT